MTRQSEHRAARKAWQQERNQRRQFRRANQWSFV